MRALLAPTLAFLIGPAVLAGTVGPAAGGVGQVAKAHPPLTTSPATVPTGGKVRVRGDIGIGPRPIRYQVKSGGKWHTVGTARTARDGRFNRLIALEVTSTRTVPIRVIAPRARVSGKVRPAVVTRTRAAKVTGPVTDLNGYEDQVLALVNQRRSAHGCSALTMQPQLRAAARGHSRDMARHDYFSHDSRDGRTFTDRIVAAGYTQWTMIAENIAAGQSTPAAVMDNWMQSPGHRANILNCSLTEIGIGAEHVAGGWTYWTQDFGKR